MGWSHCYRGWPAALLFCAAESSHRRSNRCRLRPLKVKLLPVKLLQVKLSLVEPSEVRRQGRFGGRKTID